MPEAQDVAPQPTGVVATCPQCGREALQKEMIPVLGPDGPPAHVYLCVECARSHIDRAAAPGA